MDQNSRKEDAIDRFGRNEAAANLTLRADGRLGRELQGLLQDVFEGGIPLGALEGCKTIQQLIHEDAKAPPAGT